MSLESLFQHILFSEHQAEEGRRLQREVRAEISRCRENIRTAAQTLKQEQSKLEAKVRQFTEKSLFLQLLKTQEKALERQRNEIASQRNMLLQTFETIKKKLKEEEEKFIKEITDFNNEYEITRKRKFLMKEDVKIEISDLENQANTLKMDFEDKENDAICTTKHLEAEKIEISEKPQNDAECLRLKRELDLYKDENMQNIYDALQTEIEFLELTLAQKELQENH